MRHALPFNSGLHRPSGIPASHGVQLHRAPDPAPVDEPPLPNEHPVPQQEPIPSPNPEHQAYRQQANI